MKFLPLIWAMLWRSRARTWLTFFSMASAFLLFGILRTVGDVIDLGAKLAGANNLVVMGRFSFLQNMPLAYRGQIEHVAGVKVVLPISFFGAWYQDPKNPLRVRAVETRATFANDPRFVADDPAVFDAMEKTRTGAIVGRDLAQRYGWKIGDRIPLSSPLPRADGARAWSFDIVGFYRFDEARMGKLPAMDIFINYQPFDEARILDRGNVSVYFVVIEDPQQSDRICAEIDHLFENSASATRTQPEAAMSMGFIRQIGDIGLILGAVEAAVLFTLLLVAGNTMMQTFRERIPELGVLKTLGYGDRTVAALLIMESLLLVAAAAAFGLLLASLIVPLFLEAASQLPGLRVYNSTFIAGAAIAAAVGVMAAALPAWRAGRLTVVDALAAAT